MVGDNQAATGAIQVGFRGVLRRWLIDPEPQLAAPDPGTRLPSSRIPKPASRTAHPAADPQGADVANRHQAELPLPRPYVPRELVVGSAERRYPPPDLPDFYTARAPEVLPEPTLDQAPIDYRPELVREAWDFVSDRADQLVTTFYAELFYRLKEAPTMFPSNMSRQRQEFGRAVVQWVVADDPDTLSAHLAQLGADHRKFDVEPRHYEVAGLALVSAWRTMAGYRWTAEHEAAIVGSYTRLATIMIGGALQSANDPAHWGATIVGHRRLTTDFAVVRIQADAPYPYRAGQYLTLEVPTHRKEWRAMSIASAPRNDNTFDIHVRAIGASGVSAALVAHTMTGDRITLGPPRGNDLVIEPGTVNTGLLCVASGTGSAPITAVVESMLGRADAPRLYTYVGARNHLDAYPVQRMTELIISGGHRINAEVHAVLSDEPGYSGYQGRVEDVVPKAHDWAKLGVEVLVAGPDPMIAATVTRLSAAGVPLNKIHFDQFQLAS
jgi:NAD(P)H-flavin reductase/hemoglobin-like flavoprotein